MSGLKQWGTKRLLTQVACCSLMVLLTIKTAWAATAGHSMWPDFFYRLLNFSIMVGVLVFLFKKFNLKGFFTRRTERIANTLNELENKKKEAERTYDEYRKKLDELDKETDRILKEYTEQGEREKARIIANAEKAATEIRKQTEMAIQQEVKSAKEELQREIAGLSVTAAEALLKEKMVDADQQKLLDDFMTKVVEAK